jgi:hypothetical protein
MKPGQIADYVRVDLMALHRLLVQFRRCIDHLEHNEDRPDPVEAAHYWEDFVDEWHRAHMPAQEGDESAPPGGTRWTLADVWAEEFAASRSPLWNSSTLLKPCA